MTEQEDQLQPPGPGATRRRLEGNSGGPVSTGEPIGKGCLLWGAVLGIVFGLTFAFYGLGPILRHFYGEAHVGVGKTYDGSEFKMRVHHVRADDMIENVTYVAVEVTGAEGRAWTKEEFKLELDGVDEWLEPSYINVVPSMDASPTRIALAFRPAMSRAEALHLTSPRVRFDLR